MFQKCICVFVCVLCINVPPCPRTWWSIRPRNSQKSKRFQRQLLFDMSTIDDYILGWWCKCDGDDNFNAYNIDKKFRRYVKYTLEKYILERYLDIRTFWAQIYKKISKSHTCADLCNLMFCFSSDKTCFFIQIFVASFAYFHLNLYIFYRNLCIYTSSFVILPQSL